MSDTVDEELERLIDAVHCRRPRALPALRARIREITLTPEEAAYVSDWLEIAVPARMRKEPLVSKLRRISNGN